jgi:sphingolipid delta-4 desaturase
MWPRAAHQIRCPARRLDTGSLCLSPAQHAHAIMAILPHSLCHRCDLQPEPFSRDSRDLAQSGLPLPAGQQSLRRVCEPAHWHPIQYHLTHHKSLGVNGLDTDLPTAFEALFLDSVAGKAFFCTFQILFYALRPMFVYKLPLTKIHLFNIVTQLAFDYALVQFAGGRALAYLILSSFLAGSLHPCAGHFIAEHYVFEKPNKDANDPVNKIPLPETYSYYGPLNFFTYNVGLHNEHHDFPAVPWTRLPTLNRIAHEFYAELPTHKSWVNVMWQFVWDKDISLWCRIKRQEGGRKVGAGSAWNEEELGANEKKGPIPGVR